MKRTEKRWALWDRERNTMWLQEPRGARKELDTWRVKGIEQVVRVTIEFEVPDEGQ